MIEIKSISKKYGRHKVLDNVSFTVSSGDCIGIVGANGSGKTTLLSIICGIHSADKGSISLDGKDITNSKEITSKYISCVSQENPLINELSAMDNLRLWFKGTKSQLNSELDNGILHVLGIDDFVNKPVSKLSGGMKKRLSIGIALLEKPTLLIMDEPSAALDIAGKYDIRKYMKYYTEELNGSIIVVSHDQNELSICNKLFLLKDGILKEIPASLKDDELRKLL